MARLNGDIEIIQAELNFLRTQYEQSFRERDLRKLKGLSLWISKLEKKLETVRLRNQKQTTDYLQEYKNGKVLNGNYVSQKKSRTA